MRRPVAGWAPLLAWSLAGLAWGGTDQGQVVPASAGQTQTAPAQPAPAIAPPSAAPSIAPSSTMTGTVPPSSTLAAAPSFSSTLAIAQGAVPSATVAAQPTVPAPRPAEGGAKPAPPAKPAASPPKPAIVVPYEELHKHASIVIMPSAFSAHYKGPTGENAEIFLAWYIGTLYNEKGLFIAPIFSLFVGADLKWSFLEEHTIRPAFALGYYGGLGQPFTGGAVKASSLAGKQAVKQVFVHDAYLVTGKHFGPVAISAGALYGFKKAFPLIFPMLRNGSYSTASNPASDTIWTAFGGVDVSIKEQHVKVEVITLPVPPTVVLPGDTYVRPWLIQTHVDAFLGFDLAYLKDRIGYEVIGYYLLPFYRWPDKKRLEKEADKIARARKS